MAVLFYELIHIKNVYLYVAVAGWRSEGRDLTKSSRFKPREQQTSALERETVPDTGSGFLSNAQS